MFSAGKERLVGPQGSRVEPTATREFYVCDEQLYLYDEKKKQRSKFQTQTNVKTVFVDCKNKLLNQRSENRGIQIRIKESTNTF